jgi:restriction endonuclease S subunit
MEQSKEEVDFCSMDSIQGDPVVQYGKYSYYFAREESFTKNRLDTNFNHPHFNVIEKILRNSKFDVIHFGETLDSPNSKYLLGITKGKTPPSLKYERAEGIPFIGATCIKNERVMLEEAPLISESEHRSRLLGSQLKENDVLITIAGSIGRCAVYQSKDECNANQAVAIVKVNLNNIVPRYLVKYLNSSIGQLFFAKLQNISAQPNISLEELLHIQIMLPNLNTQHKILENIKAVEDEISKIDCQIEDVRQASEGILLDEMSLSISEDFRKRKYFYKTGKDERSPYFTVNADKIGSRLNFAFYEPELDIIEQLEKKYSTTRLDKIGKIDNGEQPEYTEAEDESVIAIKTVDVKDGYIDYDKCLRATRKCFERYPLAHVKKGNVLITCTGYVSMGKVDVYQSEKDAIAAQDLRVLKLNESYDPFFITYFLRSPIGKVQFEKWWIGSSGQIHLEPEDLAEFVVIDNSEKGIPYSRQVAIASKVTKSLIALSELERRKEQVQSEIESLFEQEIGLGPGS